MNREDLFNIIKNSSSEYNTISKIENLTEKLPTLNSTDFKVLTENPILLKIIRNYLANAEDLEDDFKDLLERIIKEVPSNPIIIGVAGTWGKTTTCNLLYKYLRAIGKHACLISSSKIECPFFKYDSNNSHINTISDNNYIKEFVKKALMSNPDYIIIEVHELEICKRQANYNGTMATQAFRNLAPGQTILDDIPFDYKILTSFEEAVVMSAFPNEDIVIAIKDFIIPQENQVSFINLNGCSNAEAIYNSCKSGNLKWQASTILARHQNLYNILKNENKIYSEITNFFTNIDGCDVSFDLNGTTYISTISNKFEIAVDAVSVASILEYLNLFDKTVFDNCLATLKQADQIIKLTNNRKIIITQNNYIDYTNVYKLHEINPDAFAGKPQNSKVIVIQSSPSRYGYGIGTYEEYISSKAAVEPIRKHDWIDSNCWQYVDKLIITPDSPGEVTPEQACADVKEIYDKYLPKENTLEIVEETDRKLAISQAVANLETNDILIISGRGTRTQYFCKADKKIHNGHEVILFSDLSIVLQTINDIFGMDTIIG